MKLAALLPKIGYLVILVTVFLFPLFFLTTTPEFYEFNKQALLYVSSLSLLIIWTATFVVSRRVRLTHSPWGLPILAVTLAFLISTVFKTPNRAEAFLVPGQTGTYLALTFFFFAATHLIATKKQLGWLAAALVASVALLGLTALLESSGLFPRLLPPSPLDSPWWTPTGHPLATLVSLLALLPFMAILTLKEKALSRLAVISLAMAAGLTLTATSWLAYRLVRNQPPVAPASLPYSTGWAIALEVMKQTPLVGTGPTTFPADFTQYRPVTFNLSPFWATRFTTSSNLYLELLTTVGALGLAAYVFFVWRSWQIIRRVAAAAAAPPLALASGVSLLTLFALQLFFSPGLVPLILLVVFLVFTVTSLKLDQSPLVHQTDVELVASEKQRTLLLPWAAFTLALTVSIGGLYLFGRAYRAEVLFQKALKFTAANQGKPTYDTLIAAIKANPYADSYRVAYSQTNLLLANSIAANPAVAGLTETDRTTISQLVQQAIREARNAVALNPKQVANLENLANIYRNLVNFAQGADTWAITSYRQAMALDPVNPNLRIALGGIHFAKKDFDEAIRFFGQAVDLKPDLANAHYNLAAAYREKGEAAKAVASLNTVLQLVDPALPDYSRAQTELVELQKKLGETPIASPAAAAAPPGASELTTPQPLPTPIVQPPLQLPTTLGPQAPATPASTPTGL